MNFDLFEYENQTFAIDLIARNFLSVYQTADEPSRAAFLEEIAQDENDLLVYISNLIGDTVIAKTVFKQVRQDHMNDKKEFDSYHLAVLYYKLPIKDRLSIYASSSVLQFHIRYLKLKKQGALYDYSSNIRYFIHLLEILEYAYTHKIKFERFLKDDIQNLLQNIENENIQTKKGSIKLDNNNEDETKKQEPHYILIVDKNSYEISSHFTLKNINLKSDLINFKRFYVVGKKKHKTSGDYTDTTKENEVYCPNQSYVTTAKKVSAARELEEDIEEGIARRQNIQVRIDPKKNSKSRQHKRILAISAAISKNKLQLPSLYTLPSVGFLSEFCQYLIEKMEDGEEQYYCGLFIISVIMGIKPEETSKIFFGNQKSVSDDNTVELMLSGEYFAKYERFDEDVGISIADTMTYKIPFELIHLIHKMDDVKVKYSDTDFREVIRNKKKRFRKKIHINFQKIWHCSLVHKKLLYKNINTEIMLATKNIDKNTSPIVAYTATSSRMEEYSSWLIEYMDLLGIKAHLQRHIFGKAFSNERVINTDDEGKTVGSRKLVKRDVFIEFMKKLEGLLKERRLDKYTRFNVYSIHVRYTLSLLLGTRDFAKSVDLSHISWKHNVIIIQEKGRHKNSGFRCIPLSDLAQTVIRNYLQTLESFRIDTKAVVLFDKKEVIPLTLSSMQSAFREFSFYKKHMVLYEMLNLIPLNLGRHLITSMATAAGIRHDDMNAFMGHAVNGGELLGIFSMHNTKKYREVFMTILDEIAQIYVLKDIKKYAAL
jgi:hypothetical protein